MTLIKRTLSVLALSVAVASPVAVLGAAPAEAAEISPQESVVAFAKFKKHHVFKKHHSFKKHHGHKKHHGFKKFHHFKHYKG